MKVYSVGDSALTIQLGNVISEELNNKVLSMLDWLQENPFEGMKELVVAFNSLMVYYDPFIVKKRYQPDTTIYKWVEKKLKDAYELSAIGHKETSVVHRIPVCYEDEFGIDIADLADQKKISKEMIIQLHTAKPYRVYMIGFLPGFPYMAEVDGQLAIPRKQKPVLVEAGSVGIAGNQTGIYPFKSPGGWVIIGRTPLSLFNSNPDPQVLLKPGDFVQFYAITREEF